MRTGKEILLRIKEIAHRDIFGIETDDLIMHLDFEDARQFLKEGITPEIWAKGCFSRDPESVEKGMLEYMPFAWEKANGCRGISAYRSMSHFNAWTWLAGDDLGDLLKFSFYGKDNLVKICEHYGWDHTQWDDGIRINPEDEL